MTTFPLSTGTDMVTGTANADVIIGKSTDWQAADTIDGAGGPDILQITGVSAASAVVTDALFQKVAGVETLALLGSFAEKVTVGALSEAAGIAEIDGSGLTGALTVDASARVGGIAIDASKGVNTLTGSIDNDTFRFTSAGLGSTDTVNGGGMGDSDAIQITDKAAVTDTAFTHVTHVERLTLGGGAMDYTGQKVTLGALSVNAGITEVDVLDAQGATLDATARATGITFHGNNGNDVFKASQGNDSFDGGAGSDSYQVKGVQFTPGDAIDGGMGQDEIRIMDSGTAIVDLDFASVLNVETLAFNATGAQSVTLGGFAKVSGLDAIDASKLTGSLNLTVANSFSNSLQITLGSGVDTLNLGTGSTHSVTMKSSQLTAADTLIGKAGGNDMLKFTDAVKLTDKYFLNASGVDNFTSLLFDNTAKGQSLVAGDNFKNFVAASDLKFVFADGASKDTSFTFDFSKYTGNQLFIVGSGGSDVFIAGSVDCIMGGAGSSYDQGGADTFRYKSAWYNPTDVVAGGKSGADVLSIMDTGTAIIDVDFSQTSKIEQLRLEKGAAGTSYTVTLAGKFDTSGIALVDASQAAVDVSVNAGTTMHGHTFIAGAKSNVLTGGSGDDVFQFDTKTFNGSDFVTGGTSAGGGDTLHFTTAGVISAASLANVSGIEIIQLSDKGNSIALTDTLVGSGEAITKTYDGLSVGGRSFVLTGAGKDTVDLSQLSTWAGKATVIASAGGDKYIGSADNDTFVYQKSSDLTAATQIDAGAGIDSLLLAGGTYSAAQFKGVKHVEHLLLSDTDPAAAYAISLDNTFFANIGSTHNLTVIPMTTLTGPVTIDASAVTDPLASLYVFNLAGNSVLKGTAGDDAFGFDTDNTGAFQLDNHDVVAGGAGMDMIALSSNYNGTVSLSDSDISGVTSVETLFVSVGASTDFSCFLDFIFKDAGISEINGTASQGKLDINSSFYAGAIVLHAGQNADTLITGASNDTICFDNLTFVAATLSSADKVDGGAGVNTLKFSGDATVVNNDFTNASNFQEIDLVSGSFNITLGSHSDVTGIQKVDASAAGAAVTINGFLSSKDLTLIGSSQVDILAGGSGIDHITGGGGGDFLFGSTANDIFVYKSAADSRQLAGNDLTHADTIEDFNTGDIIDISALKQGAVTVFNHGTVVNFITTDTANYFGANDVATAYDGTNTRIYVDANHDGNFNLNQDVVIQVVGNHMNDVSNAATYI